MRAALRAEYGLDLREVIEQRTMRCSDLGDLVVWLPAGSVFWRSIGGPASISATERELREVAFWLRVLDYRERGSKGEQPQRTPEPRWATDEKVQQSAESRKMAAYMARQKRKSLQ